MKLEKILVPLDGSPLAKAALPTAVQLAKASGARLLLLRAAHVRALPGGDSSEAQVRVIAEAEEYLARVKRRLTAKGIHVATSVWYGPAAPCIIEAARFYQPDLIVMTTHGRSGLGRIILGSVAESVLRGTTTPILLVRDHQAPLELPPGLAEARPGLPTTQDAWRRLEAGVGHATRRTDREASRAR